MHYDLEIEEEKMGFKLSCWDVTFSQKWFNKTWFAKNFWKYLCGNPEFQKETTSSKDSWTSLTSPLITVSFIRKKQNITMMFCSIWMHLNLYLLFLTVYIYLYKHIENKNKIISHGKAIFFYFSYSIKFVFYLWKSIPMLLKFVRITLFANFTTNNASTDRFFSFISFNKDDSS